MLQPLNLCLLLDTKQTRQSNSLASNLQSKQGTPGCLGGCFSAAEACLVTATVLRHSSNGPQYDVLTQCGILPLQDDELLDSDEDNEEKLNNAKELAGMRVRHDADELGEGETMILTLADRNILDEHGEVDEDKDELENALVVCSPVPACSKMFFCHCPCCVL